MSKKVALPPINPKNPKQRYPKNKDISYNIQTIDIALDIALDKARL